MKYFETLPKFAYTMADGSVVAATDIMVRTSIISTILNNSAVFYQYDIQDGDTPEIIADKYYNDSYRYWIVLFMNQILDPQWEWPLNYQEFNDYVNDKYPSMDVYNTVHDYQKIITQYDVNTQTRTVNTFEIDETEYNNLIPSTTTYTVPSGPVTISIQGEARSIYQYELDANEAKRTIKLLNTLYVGQIESELKKLMAK